MIKKIFYFLLYSILLIPNFCYAKDNLSHYRITHGRFKNLDIYKPPGHINGVVLMLSGNSGWNKNAVEKSHILAEQGALVIGINTPQLYENLNNDDGNCVFPDGDLENLSRFVQAYEKLPNYYTPLLVGEASGATLAYAMIAKAPPHTFSGALTFDFCSNFVLQKPFCEGDNLNYKKTAQKNVFDLLPALKLQVPWYMMFNAKVPNTALCSNDLMRTFMSHTVGAELVPYADKNSQSEQLKATYNRFNTQHSTSTSTLLNIPVEISGLPIIEIPSPSSATSLQQDVMAILISGDGGWAGLDSEAAAALANRGISVVGLDSLRYFWSARTPESTAADIERLIHFYRAKWHKNKVVLIGYSQGADVLPFTVNRLSSETLSHIPLVALVGLGMKATFQFHVSQWISTNNDGLPIPAEVTKLPAGLALCIYGAEEDESACPKLNNSQIKLIKLPGGHHFDGDYNHLVEVITSNLP